MVGFSGTCIFLFIFADLCIYLFRSCPVKERRTMARNADVRKVDFLVLNGKEYNTYNYAGCQKCPNTLEKEPFYEISMKTKRKYPLSSNVYYSSSSGDNSDTSHLQVSKNNDSRMQCAIVQPNISELEHLIMALQEYTSSLMSKLKVYKESENTESP